MTTYFVRNGGPGPSGLSDALAFGTYQEALDVAVPNDTIQLADSSVFREDLTFPTGTAGNPITTINYVSVINGGGGTNPQVSGARLLTGWTLDSGNVWQNTGVTENLGGLQVFFDDVKGVIDGVASKAAIAIAGDWFLDGGLDILYVFSTSDPDTAFTAPGVEIHSFFPLQFSDIDYLTFTNICFAKGGRGSINVEDCDNWIFNTCDFTQSVQDAVTVKGCQNWQFNGGIGSDCGQRKSPTPSTTNGGLILHISGSSAAGRSSGWIVDGMTSRDNGEGFITTEDTVLGLGSSGLVVKNCNITNSIEEGLTFKYGIDFTVEDNIFDSAGVAINWRITTSGTQNIRRNVFKNALSARDGCIVFNHANTSGTHNYHDNKFFDCEGRVLYVKLGTAVVNFFHNTLFNVAINTANNGLFAREAIRIDTGAGGVNIKNNIIVVDPGHGTAQNQMCMQVPFVVTGLVEENNFWMGPPGSPRVIKIQGVEYDDAEITGSPSAYTTAEGLGQNSHAGDEDMVAPATDDFRLNSSFSDAVQGGQVGTGITLDFIGATFRSPPNMGTLAGDTSGGGGGGGGTPTRAQAPVTSEEAGAPTTSHTVSLPPSLTIGNVVLVFFGVDNNNTVITWPGTFTEFFNVSLGGSHRFAAAYREVTGAEGATITVTTDLTEFSSHIGIEYQDVEVVATQPPEASTGATGTSANPDPDSITPTGGVKNYRYLAAYCVDEDKTFTTAPSGYTDPISIDAPSTAGVGVAVAELASAAASEDPGTFAISLSEGWIAATIALHPAPAVGVSGSGAFIGGSFVGSGTGLGPPPPNYTTAAVKASIMQPVMKPFLIRGQGV